MGVQKNAVVLLSGGLDSATVMGIAAAAGYRIFALSFEYGQRHQREVEAAAAVARHYGVARHVTQHIDLRAFGGSALTADIAVPKDALAAGAARSQESEVRSQREEIPVTYVPARNLIFLSFALGFAETSGAFDIFIGVNAVDYSGYPDCRPAFVEAFERVANLGTKAGVEAAARGEGGAFRVHAPLMRMTKGEIVRKGLELGVPYGVTHSCYDPTARGEACGHCDSCLLRLAGFKEAGVRDPVRYVGG